MKQITYFTLGTLVGALGMYAYREFQDRRELKLLRELTPETPRKTQAPTHGPTTEARVMAFQELPAGVLPLYSGVILPEMGAMLRQLLGPGEPHVGDAPDRELN